MQGDDDDPRRWLGDTPMLNLSDDKLRLRVQTVVQFSRNDTEKLRSICRYVASVPFDVPPFAPVRKSRTTLKDRKPVGWFSKAALFQAMLRTAGFPARARMVRVGPEMYRGLATGRQTYALPVVEVWTGDRWVITDNYVYDPPYLAAAREAVQQRGWRSGFGVHLDGQTDWDGVHDAMVMIVPDRKGQDGRPSQFLGVYDDPLGLLDHLRRKAPWRWLVAISRNRIMSIRIHRQIRRLRREAGG